MERPIRILKYEPDLVSVASPVPKGLGVPASERIHQMQHVPFADCVVAEGPDRLLPALARGRISRRLLLNAEELVVQYPVGLDIVVRAVAHHLALQSPGTSQMIDQTVSPFRRRLRGDRQ